MDEPDDQVDAPDAAEAPEPPEPEVPDSSEPGTSHPAVDEVLRSLERLEDVPVDEHVAAFEQAHDELRRTLSEARDHDDVRPDPADARDHGD